MDDGRSAQIDILKMKCARWNKQQDSKTIMHYDKRTALPSAPPQHRTAPHRTATAPPPHHFTAITVVLNAVIPLPAAAAAAAVAVAVAVVAAAAAVVAAAAAAAAHITSSSSFEREAVLQNRYPRGWFVTNHHAMMIVYVMSDKRSWIK
uniref:Uncharacterized protein n=1 Tax=Wuchereria bancrofti TaxID=6293 RepID=A0AAF5Q5M7_WUCBA